MVPGTWNVRLLVHSPAAGPDPSPGEPREHIMGPFLYALTAAMAAIFTFVLMKLFDRLRRRDAESEAREIVRKAQQDVENRRREAELEIKELLLQQQAESEKELRRLRGELHERERLLDKRQDALEQQAEQLRKQEKMVEGTQRKLTERIQDANRRKEELAKLLDMQRQTLHELSGLSQDEATRRLLEMLEPPVAAGDRGGDPRATSGSWPRPARQRTREVLLTSLAALRRRRTRPKPPPAPSTSPTTK